MMNSFVSKGLVKFSLVALLSAPLIVACQGNDQEAAASQPDKQEVLLAAYDPDLDDYDPDFDDDPFFAEDLDEKYEKTGKQLMKWVDTFNSKDGKSKLQKQGIEATKTGNSYKFKMQTSDGTVTHDVETRSNGTLKSSRLRVDKKSSQTISYTSSEMEEATKKWNVAVEGGKERFS